MTVFLLLLAIFCVHALSIVLNKKCSNVLSVRGNAGKAVYVLITGIFSSFLYWGYSSFTLELNRTAVIFALIFGICSTISALTVTMYKYVDIATVNVTKTSLNLIVASLVGFIIFAEPATMNRLTKLALTLVVVFLIFFNNRNDIRKLNGGKIPQTNARSNFLHFLLLIAIQLPVFAFSAYQSKLIAKYDAVPDLNSYYCLTNVFMAVFGVIWVLVLASRDKENVKKCLEVVRSKDIFTMLLLLTNGTFNALLSVIILKYMDVSLYSPLSSALAFIGTALVSLLFREKLSKFTWIAVIISIIVVVI